MSLPDNRIRLPAPKIDFNTDVGITGQDHDLYPNAGDQARFDHQRMYLIGLLSQQSSYSEPSQKRDGTPWFDLNTVTLKVWFNNAWHLYSEIIPLNIPATDDVTLTLKNWYDSVVDSLSALSPDIVFNGEVNTNGANTISIPASLRSYLTIESRCFVYVNGLLLDPRNCTFDAFPATSITLVNAGLEINDKLTIIIKRIPDVTYYETTVQIS